jgi:hypothetical protein
MTSISKIISFWPWLIFSLYPFVFGLLLLSFKDHRPFLLSGQAIELYVLSIVVGRTVWIVRTDVKARVTAPFSYIRAALFSAPIAFFFVVASVLLGFGVRWAAISA